MTVNVSRRGLFGALGLAGIAVAGPALLSGCRTESKADTSNPSAAADKVLPTFKLKEYVKPDFPAPANGYTKLPTKFEKAFAKPPVEGTPSITAMVPLWSTIPKTTGNAYIDAVNKGIGANIKLQISDGNSYGDKLATVLANQKGLPDWLSLPTWNLPARFGDQAPKLFEDLGPYLSGDKVLDYPHLASLPTDAWKYCVWDGRLIGLPLPDSGVPNPLFYRADEFKKRDVKVPTTPDEVLETAKKLTDAKKGVYGTEDLWNQALQFFAVPLKWKQVDGKLVHKFESEEYRQALEWCTKLFAAKVVHPESIAGSGNAKERFEAGKSLMMSDGIGGWVEARQRQASINKDFDQQAMPVIGNGKDKAVVWKGAALGIFSTVKKGIGEEKVKQILKAADYMAAPFGTEEFQTLTYGVKGVHYNLDDKGVPQLTKLGSDQVQPLFKFLVTASPTQTAVQFPHFVDDISTWINETAAKYVEPLFYGVNITEPNQYASIGQPFTDLEKDIVRGRKSMKDLDKAIETWKKAGGDKLREFYQKILDESKKK